MDKEGFTVRIHTTVDASAGFAMNFMKQLVEDHETMRMGSDSNSYRCDSCETTWISTS